MREVIEREQRKGGGGEKERNEGKGKERNGSM